MVEEDGSTTWACEACTFHNQDGAVACDMCGTPNPTASGGGGGSEDDGSAAYWSCQACTMQNPQVTFTCHLCGTVDEGRRAKAKEAGDGTADDGVSPALLARLARDGHFSLQNYLTKLCHTLALAAAEAETGLSRPSIDRAFIPILLELMSDPGSRRGPDVPLQACRALNYFLQIGAAGDVGVQRGMRTYALCITCAATAGTAEYQELGQEAVSGVDLLCRTSAEFLRELAETDIGGGGGRVLASFVRGVYRAPAVRRNSITSATSPSAQSPGGAASQPDERRSTRAGAGAGAGAAAEAAVAKALSLLPLLLDLRPRPPGRGGSSSSAAAAFGDNNSSATPAGGGSSALASSDEELEAVLSALLAVVRGASASNREAALAALGSKILPRLGGAAAGGREWLGELITDEGLLVAAIEDRSQRGAACHQRALGLTYQLLASSTELMSLALEPGCPLLPTVLDALDDAGGGGSGAGDALARTSIDGGAGAMAPGTPRSAPRTPRLSGMSGERRGNRGAGGTADGETAARSGLAVLRIIGLVAAAFLEGRLPKASSLLISGSGSSRGQSYTPGPAIMVQVQPESQRSRSGSFSSTAGSGTASAVTANGPGAATATGVVVGGGGGAHSLGASNAAVIRRGNSIKEHQERRARLLADLGDGTVLVAWGNTGVEEVIASRRILLSSSTSLTSRARRSLARHSLFRTMMSLAGDPGSGDSDSNGDSGGPGIDDDPLASFSLSALGALGALGRVGGIGGGGGTGGQGGGGGGAGGHAERSILNDFLGQFIQSGNATTVRHVLASGADPNRLIRPGHSSLMAAAAHEGGPAVALEMTRILLDAGADAGYVGPEGSALHSAAAAGRGEVVSALIEAGAELDATDSQGSTPLEVCTNEPVMGILTQALEEEEVYGGAETPSDADATGATSRTEGSEDTEASSREREASAGTGDDAVLAVTTTDNVEVDGDENVDAEVASLGTTAPTLTAATDSASTDGVDVVAVAGNDASAASPVGEGLSLLSGALSAVAAAVTETSALAGASSAGEGSGGCNSGREEAAVLLELPSDNGEMIRILLQALGRSFMSNAAAAQGLSSALAPPSTSGTGGTGPQARTAGCRSVGSAGACPQHPVCVSLGKAWLEIFIKLMRRAGGGADHDCGSAEGSSAAVGRTSDATVAGAVVVAALEDASIRDSLLVLFERTAAGIAAAAVVAAPAVAPTGAEGAAGTASLTAEELNEVASGKAPAWADPALVLRSLVLLREVLVRVPDAYVVPLRRRGVLHSIRTVVTESSKRSKTQHATSTSSPHVSLGAAISAAAQDIIDLCDAHQSMSSARSLAEKGGGGGSGVEGVDRLAAAATSLSDAVAVLRRLGRVAGVEGVDGEEEEKASTQETAGAKSAALAAVRDLADLLPSEDGITAFEALESGVLPPLRELLAWLEAATSTTEAKVATELEYEAVGALATVTGSSSSSLGSQKLGGKPEGNGTPSEAVLQLVSLIHDVIGVEVLQVDGPDSRHAPTSGNHGGFLGGARGLFGAGSPFGAGAGGGGAGGLGAGPTGIEALSVPMMLQLRPSKDALCNVRSRAGAGGGEDPLEASLTALARGTGSGRGGSGGGTAGAAGDALAILASVQPLAKLSQLREFVLRSVHIMHPAYLEYCRGLLGAMVCIKSPQGTQPGSGLADQGLGGGMPLGRSRTPWEGQDQAHGTGQGRLFRAVGWDEETGTHLLLSVPGVEEDTPWEQYLQVVLAEMSYRILLPEKARAGLTEPRSSSTVTVTAYANEGPEVAPHAETPLPSAVAAAASGNLSSSGAAAGADGLPGKAGAACAQDSSVTKPSPLLVGLGGASAYGQDGHGGESDDMELEEFALGESALGTGGSRGLKAAASTAASNLRRNVRSMLHAQQQQQQQHQRQANRAAWSANLLPLSTTSPSSSSGLASAFTGASGSASGSATTTVSAAASLLPNAFQAVVAGSGSSSGDGAGTDLGRNWVAQIHNGSAAGASEETGAAPASAPPRMVDLLADDGGDDDVVPPASPVPTTFGGFPPSAAAAAAPTEAAPAPTVAPSDGSPRQVGCTLRDRGAARATAPSTPVPGGVECPPPVSELKEGDSVEAQFLLADQAVWTTSWYRGKVSRVNHVAADNGNGGKVSSGDGDGGDGGGGDGEAVTFGVEFLDGDRLDEVPEGRIRLFRGLQVGSVVSVEWPSKGGRPFKGCLTRVCAGEDGKPSTVSVIYEDTDTENNVPVERLCLAEDEYLALPPVAADSASTSSPPRDSTSSQLDQSANNAPSTPGSITSVSVQASSSSPASARSTTLLGGGAASPIAPASPEIPAAAAPFTSVPATHSPTPASTALSDSSAVARATTAVVGASAAAERPGKGASSSFNRSPKRGSRRTPPRRTGSGKLSSATGGTGITPAGGGGAIAATTRGGGISKPGGRMLRSHSVRHGRGGASTNASSGGGAVGQLGHGVSDPTSTARRGGGAAAGKAASGVGGAARVMVAMSAAGGGGAGSSGAITGTRRVWVRDRIDSMRWRPGCLVPEGEIAGSPGAAAAVTAAGGGGGGGAGAGGGGSDVATSGFMARLDDGTLQVPRPDGVMDFPTAGGAAAAAAAEAASIAVAPGSGRSVRNPAAKLASITGALRRHGRNAGLGGGAGGSSSGGDDSDSGFCKEPTTPHAWLCSRQPRTAQLGFLPRFGRGNSGISAGGAGSGGGGGGGGSGGAGPSGIGRGKGGKESVAGDSTGGNTLRRHFTTVGSGSTGRDSSSAAAVAVGAGAGAAGKAGRSGGSCSIEGDVGNAVKSSSGNSKNTNNARKSAVGALSSSQDFSSFDGSASSAPAAGGGRGELRTLVSGRGGKKMSIFSGFGGGSKASGRSKPRGGGTGGGGGGGSRGGHARVATGAGEADERFVRAVPLQLEDEELLQEQGWVYPPRVCLLLAVSVDPEGDSRADWVELEEDDTIFKCVSVLQARAPPQSTASSLDSPGGGVGGTLSTTSARSPSLRDGLLGLKRSLGRGRGVEHVLFFKAHVTGGPTSVALGKNAHTGARVPCEGDIRDLSPSLVDSLLLARSVRKLCARHRPRLAVPLGQGAEGDLDGGISGGNGDGGVEADDDEEDDDDGVRRGRGGSRDTQLWVNDQLSDSVREALSDMLAVAAGFLPPWVDALLSGFPFLLPLDIRLRYFRSLAFGVTRSVAYLQQESAAGDVDGGGAGQGGAERGGVARVGRRAGGGGGGGRLGGGRTGAGIGGLGALRRDIVQVSRSQLLQHAEQVMSMYTPSKAVLEFRFAGEKGLGAGVTASFYSAVAAELQRRAVNVKPPMWVDNDSMGDPQGFLAPPSGLFPAPLPPIPGSKDGSDCRNGVADASSSSGASASFGGTLFGGDDVGGGGGGAKDKDKSGKALAQRRRSVIGRFRFLGRLAARCLMDGQVLPLPLSLDFLRLVLAVIDDHARSQGHEVIGKVPPSPTPSSSATGISDTPREASLPSATLDVVGTVEVPASLSAVHTTACCLFSVDDLPRLYHGPGMIVRNLARACKGNGSWGKVNGMPLADFLELSSLAMTDPISGAPVIRGGEDVDVTLDNVQDYVDAVTTSWLHAGLMPQADAFRAGCAEVFPVHMLRALSPQELRDQLCGEEALDWPLDHLQEAVVPGAGYTRNSQPFCDFLTCLSKMTPTAKRSFLLFVLGCPHLPPGGLSALTPPLEVSRKQGAGGAFALEEEVDKDLPFARTCTHTLHLPPYSRFEVLSEKLAYAVDNSRGVIDRD